MIFCIFYSYFNPSYYLPLIFPAMANRKKGKSKSIQGDGEDARVRFAARGHLEDPIVHWKTAGGAWQQAWMALDDRGQWVFSVPVGSASKVTWWVEPVVGDRIQDDGAPFRLALPPAVFSAFQGTM